MSSTSTTYFTFTVLTERNISSVELYGSWDGFKKPFKMERDNRCGRGHWKGCPTDIVCEGNAENKDGSSSGEAGLKMGATYWYYYILDKALQHYNVKEPYTTSCSLLPDIRVNVLDVPILLPEAPDDQRGDLTGRKFVGNKQLNHTQLGHEIGDAKPNQPSLGDVKTHSQIRPRTAPARLPAGNVRKHVVPTEKLLVEKNEQPLNQEAPQEHEKELQDHDVKIELPEMPAEPHHIHVSKHRRLRTAFAEIRPIRTAIGHKKSRSGDHEEKGKEGKHYGHHHQDHHRKRSVSPTPKKKGHGATRAKIHDMFDREDSKGVKHLAHMFKSSHQENAESEKHKHFHHLKHGHLRQKFHAAGKRKASHSHRQTHAESMSADPPEQHSVDKGHGQDTSKSAEQPKTPSKDDKACTLQENMTRLESMISASAVENECASLASDNGQNPHGQRGGPLHIQDHASILHRCQKALNISQETVVPTAAARQHQDLHLNPRTCALENDVPFATPITREISQRGPLATPIKV